MEANKTPVGWDAFGYFSKLCKENKLCREYGFVPVRVSSLAGFEGAIGKFQNSPNLLCIEDESDGQINLNNTAHSVFVKTVYLSMRHPADPVNGQELRRQRLETMREIFRQFMSRLCKERTKLQQGFLYIDNTVKFHEIPGYFFNGAACAYFNISIGMYPDLIYRSDEWEPVD